MESTLFVIMTVRTAATAEAGAAPAVEVRSFQGARDLFPAKIGESGVSALASLPRQASVALNRQMRKGMAVRAATVEDGATQIVLVRDQRDVPQRASRKRAAGGEAAAEGPKVARKAKRAKKGEAAAAAAAEEEEPVLA